MKKTACVIVTFNNQGMLEKLLEDVKAQTRVPDTTIIVDNASVDGTQETVRRVMPEAVYLRLERNQGSAGGFHEGIRLACRDNDLVWLLDDDVALEPDSLRDLVAGWEQAEKDCRVGAVRSWCNSKPGFKGLKETGSFAWRGTLVGKAVVGDIGLPEKDFFLYADDTEYSLRMAGKGYRIFWCAESRVVERRDSPRRRRGSVSYYSDQARCYYAFRNETRVFLAYRKPWRLLMTLLSAVKSAAFIIFDREERGSGKISAIGQGVFDGIAGRRGENGKYRIGAGAC